jgi:hypothetical protein
MNTQLASWLQSSQDPASVANKVKGVILVFSSLIILGAAHVFNITLSADDVVTLATEVGSVAGAVWAVYGAVLHLVTWFGTVKNGGTITPSV